jgi:hypothetical protein
MKSKINKWIILSTLLACLAPLAHADTEGTRGGGESVDKNGMPILRDIVDPATCDFRSGVDVFAQNPTVAKILAKVAKLDWYFAFDMQRQMEALNFCFTSDLLRVNTSDNPADRVTDPDSAGPTQQAGIRSGDDVFIETSVFEQMSPTSQALLLIHETTHTYLPMDTVRRNFKLRSMVKAISDVYAGKISTRNALHLAMSENSINFPLFVDQLDPIKDFVMLVIGDEATEAAILSSATDLDSLMSTALPDPSLLTEDDAVTFAQVASDRYEAILAPVCEAKDEDLITQLASEAKSFDPAMACLSDSVVRSDTDYVKFLVDHAHLAQSLQSALRELAEAQISFQDYRIMITSDVSGISASPKDSRPVRPLSELLPVSASSAKHLGSEFRSLIEILALEAKVGDIDTAIAQTGQSDLFYQALSVKSLLGQLNALSDPNIEVEELTLDQQVITDVYRAFVQQLLTQISEVAGPDAAAKIQQSIDFSKLGYTFN